MKPAVMILIFLLLPLSFASAQELNLGSFPVGTWLDSNYDAQWIFTAGNIQLRLTEGTLVFDFKDKMRDFSVKSSLKGVEMSFRCDETERMYKFVKGFSNPDLKLIIDKAGGMHYETDLKMQK